jgi:hypothetical protein
MSAERTTGAAFVDKMKADADFLGNGAIETNMYEAEIYDLIRREFPSLQRFNTLPATGHPHRYFEQTATQTAAFSDPRTLVATPTGSTRVERSVLVRAITDQTNFSLFDIDVTRQQGRFAYLEAKDIADLVTSINRLRASAIWSGTATSNSDSGSIQYCGILKQVTQQFTIDQSSSIIDGIKAQVALMVSDVLHTVRPTAIYINPILGDYIDREAKSQQVILGSANIEAGLVVKTLQTQAGPLPLIPEPFLTADTIAKYGFSAPPSASYKNYYVAIMAERDVELPYVGGPEGNPNPRLFQLGLVAGLASQYIVVKFDTIAVKGPSYAHAIGAVVRA